MDEKPTPLWRKLLATAAFLGVVACLVIFWNRLGKDFWPPDRSFVGPNLLASVVQWVVIFVIVILLWPPTRRRIHRFVDRKVETLRSHIDARHRELHERLDVIEAHHHAHHDNLARLHRKLDVLLGDDEKPPST